MQWPSWNRDNILQALPAEYKKMQNASYEKQDFGLDDIRYMVHATYANKHCIVWTCKHVGYGIPDCNALKVEVRQHERNQCVRHIHLQHRSEQSRVRQNRRQQWCSLYRWTTNSVAGCIIQDRDKTNSKMVRVPITLVNLLTSVHRTHKKAMNSNVRVFRFCGESCYRWKAIRVFGSTDNQSRRPDTCPLETILLKTAR